MKKVLITGANSYLGNNTKIYLEKHGDYVVDILDMLSESWKDTDFSQYDVVINVCAIVHRFDKVDKSLYFAVNRDLAIDIAKRAKDAGVRQFIQVSTNGVFGKELGEMNSKFGFNPKTHYEKSKYAADLALEKMSSEEFAICIVRPPIIYGHGCKGNFPKLVSFALKYHFFPSWKNKRDMIYIENICDFIKFSIDNNINECCYPRDIDCVCVSHMIKQIALLNNRKFRLYSIFNPIIAVFYKTSHKLRSIFGDNYCTEKVCGINWIPPYSYDDALKKMFEGK